MTLNVKKKAVPIDKRLDHLVTGDTENLPKSSKLKVIKEEYHIAKATKPTYEKLQEELRGYKVNLPAKPDIGDLAQINELYAIAQSFFSRVSAISMTALDNFFRWKRLELLMREYIADLESEALFQDDIRELRNKMQEAALRNKFKVQYNQLNIIEFKLSEADSFRREVETKKEDLHSVLTTLAKQVKTLSVEKSMTLFTQQRS